MESENIDEKFLMEQESVDFVFEVKQRPSKEVEQEAKEKLENQHKKLLDENYLNRSMQSFDYSYYPNQLKTKPVQTKSKPNSKMERSATLDFFGRSKSNGYIVNKINPVLDNDFAYINRNKLVNRRLAIRKNIQNSVGLKSYTSPYVSDFLTIKNQIDTEYKLANPIEFYFPEESETFSENNYGKIENTESQIHLDPQNSVFLASLNTEVQQNRDLKKRAWYTNEAKKFYKGSKSAKPVVIIEKKSYKHGKAVGPSPMSYHIPRRPPNEKSAPMYSLGKRTFKEKNGGGRSSWEKEWFSSNNPHTVKTNYNREIRWPAPNYYSLKSVIGSDSSNKLVSSSQINSIGIKLYSSTQELIDLKKVEKDSNISKEDLVEKELNNTNLLKKKIKLGEKHKKRFDSNVMESFNHLSLKAPQFSIKFRQKGTVLWPKVEKTPGPGSYDMSKFKNIIKSAPKYSPPHARLDLNSNYMIGPFAAV